MSVYRRKNEKPARARDVEQECVDETYKLCLSVLDRQIEEKRGVKRTVQRVAKAVRDLDLEMRIPDPKGA